jgi:hypothetical protein
VDLLNRLHSLKSLWGVLSTGTILFPGAAYWLRIDAITGSALRQYYLLTAVPLGAMALLLTLIFTGPLRRSTARNLAVILGLLAPVAMAGFIYVSVQRQDSPLPDSSAPVRRCYATTFVPDPGQQDVSVPRQTGAFPGSERLDYVSNGRSKADRRSCVCRGTGSSARDCSATGLFETIKDEINPAEYQTLIFFNICIILLTTVFTTLATVYED